MEALDALKDFVVLASLPTGIGVLWKATKKIVHVADRFEALEEHSKENYLNILRLIVMSPHMPDGERRLAAEKYIQYGGNGEVKQYIQETFYKEDN